MAFFTERQLQTKAKRITTFGRTAARILTENARNVDEDEDFDIFLSHAFADADYVLALTSRLEDDGHSVYVDWQVDPQLDRSKVSKTTASLLRKRMKHCNALIYAYTENSSHSAWMPWELGYFDGMSGRAAVLPIKSAPDESDTYKGREYLGLYPYITHDNDVDGTPELWVNRTEDRYVTLSEWLEGFKPRLH